jgi:GTP-binding protein HflX
MTDMVQMMDATDSPPQGAGEVIAETPAEPPVRVAAATAGSGTSVDRPERTIVVGLVWARARRHQVEEHLEELERLVDTAGGVVVERLIQERDAPDPATLVGSGFAERLAGCCSELGIRSVVFDEDLSASQARNLDRVLPNDVKVLDRAAVILDIFAQRARTREAQTQVELAQLSYLLPRLTRRWQHLSRQAGGIGTRGVGETQLEIDRRLIGKRIAQLKRKLELIERDRRQRRRRRLEQPTAALVGYTNAGKSSLFRALTHTEAFVEDRLFATLDPRSRRVQLGQELMAVLTDTVGFIRKLPHDLVAPFRSTLEEAVEADVVLHVLDGSHPGWLTHLEVGDEVLAGLGVSPERVLVVLNKIDLLDADRLPQVPGGRASVAVSARTGDGLDMLRGAVRELMLAAPDVLVLRVPLAETGAVSRAVALPHQLARSFSGGVLQVAARVEPARLGELALDGWRVPRWQEPQPES